MRARTNIATWATAVLAAACGGGGTTGGAGSGGSSEASFGVVSLLDQVPADGAVQFALDAVIVFEFDAPMALDSFGDEDTWLRAVGSPTSVPGTFALGSSGRVSFQPAAPLLAETDYEFQLSALTCDQSGRILDQVHTFTFRTFDATPPTVLGTDVANNTQGVSRTRSFAVTFSEAIAADSVNANNCYLRDVFGTRYAAGRTVAGAQLTLQPYADLPGDRQFQLVVGTTVADRAGNRLGNALQITFRTAVDTAPPRVDTAWPAMSQIDVSPKVQPVFTFDESMDTATVEAVSLLFQDEFGSVVPFAIDSTPDQRQLRVRPLVTLVAARRYTLAFLLGDAAATDVSGNTLVATQARTFTTGTDAVAPTVTGSVPGGGENRMPGNAPIELTFDEPLDPARVSTTTVTLLVDGQPWTTVVERPSPARIRLVPVLTLPTDTPCVVTVRGGQDGVRDLAGNVLAADHVLTFTTSSDANAPGAMLLPADGATGIAPGVHMSVVFDAPMDPATVDASRVLFTDDAGTPLPGSFVVRGGDRVVTFTPSSSLLPQTYYRIRITGGPNGVRRTTGNWLLEDRTARFRTGTAADQQPPSVQATVNGIPSARQDGLLLPPSGFTIDVTTSDSQSQWVDMGQVEILLQGTGSAPSADQLLAAASIGYGTLRVVVPPSAALGTGQWLMTVRATDLAGNVGTAGTIAFSVATPDAGMLPFERTQLVFVRTDLDRDGSGTPDFDDDMLRLGFATAGDPAGTNAYVRSLLLDGILAQANRLYGRGARGEPTDSGSVALRFTKRAPIALPHMQMALGGLDPEGDRTRGYGAESTGVLGRAYYDYRNGNIADRNIASSPGLGVFPAEMWLYQTDIHLQVWPSFQTVFAQRFRPLCPDMGGTAAGSHPLDAQVLRADFDPNTGTSPQRARYFTVMEAADDWATVIGIILAHEVGHSVGLVAPGAAPSGLFGDSSLHDTYAGAAEVMAPSVGYEAMTSLEYQFRDIDLAYLRQRVLLR